MSPPKNDKDNKYSNNKPLTVAVIGCGPAGMFYCHSIETILRNHADSCGTVNNPSSIKVTCFEREAQPGGVWRSEPDSFDTGDHNDKSNKKQGVQMYAALWTNGPSHCIEFHDYTYDEHFKNPVPVYLPRQAYLDYIIGRVTRHCPDFFEKYVEFGKDVEHVVYDELEQRFCIRIRDMTTGQVSVRWFDKCVWACGDNGKKSIPSSLQQVFEKGHFRGRLLHSAETAEMEENVRGKRVLLVGGGYSAEDLALQAIKWGVEKVYIAVRSFESAVFWTKAWPMNKVEVLQEQAPSAVTEGGRCIQFRCVESEWPNTKKFYGPVETELRDIDTVIFCTGYKENMDMLDNSIRREFEISTKQCKLTLPKGWKMQPNDMTEVVGELKPGKCIYAKYSVHPRLFRGMLISNPNMMFMLTYGSYIPIVGIDLYSWVLAAYTTGFLSIPSAEAMREQNCKEAVDDMQIPYLRSSMDSAYFDELNELEDFWPDDYTEVCPIWSECQYQYELHQFKKFAGLMREVHYPLDMGTSEELNDHGYALLEFDELSYYHRFNLDPNCENEIGWRTFRDYNDAENFYSIYTGTKAIPLPRRWLEIDDAAAEDVMVSSATSIILDGQQ